MESTHDTPGRIIHLWMDITRQLRRGMLSHKKSEPCMNPMQVHGLMIIAEHPNITMKEFAAALHISSPSATSFVDRLVKMKCVERVPDETNRKLVHLRLLPEGKNLLETTIREHSEIMRGLFSLLNTEDQTQLERILVHLKEALARSVSSR